MKKTLILLIILLISIGLFAYTAVEATWTTSVETVNGQEYFVAVASKAVTIANSSVYTEPTDFKLNWNAPIIVIVNPDGGVYDDETLPLEMYCGYSDDFDLSTTSAGVATITDGWEFGTIEADVDSTLGQVMLYGVFPTLADDTDDFYFVAPCPELAFELTAVTAFPTATIEIILMQPCDIGTPSTWFESYGK
jgi:hypothetical protein